MNKKMYLFNIFLLYLITCQTNNDKLIFAMTHFRHGARAPIFGENSDFMKEYWEYPGELTLFFFYLFLLQ